MKYQVYPRVCGGTLPRQAQLVYQEGLSPRVRGNLQHYQWHFACVRSIPACAGEPTQAVHGSEAGKVYPRVCGGTPQIRSQLFWKNGLSPRVRGNPGLLCNVVMMPRSIPACAGEPLLAQNKRDAHPVYPRVCGGTISRS